MSSKTPPDAIAVRPSADLSGAADYYLRQSHADSTWTAYKDDWQRFVTWCEQGDLVARPADPGAVANYAIHLARDRRQSVRTVRRAMAAIGWAHTSAGIDPPPTHHEAVRGVLRGIAREHGRPPKKAAPIAFDDLLRLLGNSPDTLAGKRDRALLSLGYFGAFRRSELVGLDVADVQRIVGGFRVTLRRSKTDQEGKGEPKGIKQRDDAADPVSLLNEWLRASGIQSGALFRAVDVHGHVAPGRMSGRAVALIVKRACKRAGISERDYSGHSLRRGFATEAARGGADGLIIRKTTKHKSDRMVDEYVDEGTLLGRHAQDYIGKTDEDGS